MEPGPSAAVHTYRASCTALCQPDRYADAIMLLCLPITPAEEITSWSVFIPLMLHGQLAHNLIVRVACCRAAFPRRKASRVHATHSAASTAGQLGCILGTALQHWGCARQPAAAAEPVTLGAPVDCCVLVSAELRQTVSSLSKLDMKMCLV